MKKLIVTLICLAQMTSAVAGPRQREKSTYFADLAKLQAVECNDNGVPGATTECNVSQGLCTGCMVAAVVAAALSFGIGGASGMACAAPCGVAAGMCGRMNDLKQGRENCLNSRALQLDMYAQATASAHIHFAELSSRVNTELNRHKATVKALQEYPAKVLKELYAHLKTEGVDSDHGDGKEFITEKMNETYRVVDQKMKEEKRAFNNYYVENFQTIWMRDFDESWSEFANKCQSYWVVKNRDHCAYYDERGIPCNEATYYNDCVLKKCAGEEYDSTSGNVTPMLMDVPEQQHRDMDRLKVCPDHITE
jgi:hypothetical protein